MRIVAIIQARTGSTRLPGKVLRRLCGVSVLGQVIRRVKACRMIGDVVVATTVLPSDDAIEAEAKAFHCEVFRGSEQDVLSRYFEAATAAKADVVVRVTSDCPLLDSTVLCQMLEVFVRECSENGVDYLSNTFGKRTFPRGLDVEVFTSAALARAHREATASWDREHVTPYIYNHPQTFVLKNFQCASDLSEYRWTLDTQADWQLIRAIYEGLGVTGSFSTADILKFLQDRPDLVALNAHVAQKEPGNQ